MANHVSGTSTPTRVPPPCLDELRQPVLALLFGNPLITETGQLRANHCVHACEEVARLTRWPANGLAEIARRPAAAARPRGRRALRTTRCSLRPGCWWGLRPRPFVSAWAPSAPLPDRPASPVDRLAAACFQPADAVTRPHRLCHSSR